MKRTARIILAFTAITLATATLYTILWLNLITSGLFWHLAKRDRLNGLPLPIVQLIAGERGTNTRAYPNAYTFDPDFPLRFIDFRSVTVFVGQDNRVIYSLAVDD